MNTVSMHRFVSLRLYCCIVLALSLLSCSSSKSLVNGKNHQQLSSSIDTVATTNTIMQNDSLGNSKDTFNSLSIASELLIKACDNYLSINYSNSKAADVLNIKASVFYNNRLFEEARKVYSQIINDFEGTGLFYDAIRMTAQAFYEEKKFDEAQEWYRKLSNVAKSGDDKIQAVNKIAESIFRMAESYEEQGRLKEASEQYERVALEFPESKIAEVALFNGGLVREKMAEWSSAIIAFQKIIQKYPNSNLLAKTNFRIAKNYEKMLQWDFAAEAYLNV
ncbi:MAG: tetratricopeptide repeat protein, partial [Fibrobacter sp.]|nr:tetratricopeptide repeat protein [Fibrobacter sp.]